MLSALITMFDSMKNLLLFHHASLSKNIFLVVSSSMNSNLGNPFAILRFNCSELVCIDIIQSDIISSCEPTIMFQVILAAFISQLNIAEPSNVFNWNVTSESQYHVIHNQSITTQFSGSIDNVAISYVAIVQANIASASIDVALISPLTTRSHDNGSHSIKFHESP
jgi:hypothetical protein